MLSCNMSMISVFIILIIVQCQFLCLMAFICILKDLLLDKCLQCFYCTRQLVDVFLFSDDEFFLISGSREVSCV